MEKDEKNSCDSWDNDPEIQEIKELEENLEMEIMQKFMKEEINFENVLKLSPVKLKVEVEVEQCSVQIEVEKSGDENEVMPEQTASCVTTNTSEINDDILEQFKVTKIIQSYTALVQISARELVEEAKKYYESNNYADRYLAALLINSVSSFEFRKRTSLEPDYADIVLQHALDDWRLWFSNNRKTDIPMFYKCYICNKAWWDLYPFREHIRQHNNNYKVIFENLGYESNIVAFSPTLKMKFKNIKIAGRCTKCDRPCLNHLFKANNTPELSEQMEHPYFCTKCPTSFSNCSLWRVHDEQHNPPKVFCKLCKLGFQSEQLIQNHLRTAHTVRSDRPSPIPTKLCTKCHSNYLVYKTHSCYTKVLHWCNKCFKQYETKSVKEIHAFNSNSSVTCKICLESFPDECLMVQHYMTHTNNFIIEFMCVQCQCFLHKSQKKKHIKNCLHNGLEGSLKRSSWWFLPMIVPAELFLSKIESLDGTEVHIEYNRKEKAPPKISKEDELEAALKGLQQDMGDEVEICNPEPLCIDLTSEPEQDEQEEEVVVKTDKNDKVIIKIEKNDEVVIKTEKNDDEMNTYDEFEDDIIKFQIDKHELQNKEVKIKKKVEEKIPPRFLNARKKKATNVESMLTKPMSQSMMDTHFCTKCVKEFKNRFMYLNHFTDHYYKPNMCPICLVVSDSMVDLADHFQSHLDMGFTRITLSKTDQQFECKLCSRLVYNKELFPHWENHFELVPLKEEDRYIPIAKTTSNQSVDTCFEEPILKLLIELITTKQKPRSINFCIVCLKDFKKSWFVKNHLLEHLLQDSLTKAKKVKRNNKLHLQLKCQLCSKTLEDSTEFKLHVMKEHANIPIPKCHICDKMFTSIVYLTKHFKSHADDDESLEIVEHAPDSIELSDDESNDGDETNDVENESSDDGGEDNVPDQQETQKDQEEVKKQDNSQQQLNLHTEIKLEPVDDFEDDIININNEISALMKTKAIETSIFTAKIEDMSDSPSTSRSEHQLVVDTLQNVKVEVMDHSEAASIDSQDDHDLTEQNTKHKKKKAKNQDGDHDYAMSDSSLTSNEEYIPTQFKVVKRKKRGPPRTENLEPHTCTKCNVTYSDLHTYISHFSGHGYEENCCPKCGKFFETTGKLILHVKQHINHIFVKIKFIKTEEKAGNLSKCKQCNKIVVKSDFFSHWESHLELDSSRKESNVNKLTTVKVEKHVGSIPEGILKKMIDYLLDESRRRSSRKCMVCQREFLRGGDIKRHLVEHLLEDAKLNGERTFYSWTLRCQICSAELHDIRSYKSHLREHASMPIYTCELCNRVFSDSSNFTKHKKVHNLEKCRCKICDKKFQTMAMLDKHMEVHDKKPIKCPYCPVLSYTASLSRKHIKMFHLKSPRLPCPLCPEQLGSVKEKWDHLWEKHKLRKEQWDCNACGASFRKFRDLKDHYKDSHHIKYVNVMLGKKKEYVEHLLLRNPAQVTVKVENA